MKYQYSEENRRQAIRRNRTSTAVTYSVGAVVMINILFIRWFKTGIELKLPLIAGLIILPLAWMYFDRNFRSKISRTYEIQNEHLVIEEKGTVKHKISLDSIKELKKIPNGHRIKSVNGTAYILDGIDNKDELLGKITLSSGSITSPIERHSK